MRFHPLDVDGAFLVEFDVHSDERGHFTRTFDAEEFADHGLSPDLAQGSSSFNRRAGTIRGMHWQCAPATETKLVRCTRGAVWDTIVDVRPESPTYGRVASVELAPDSPTALYVPACCAHGFQTLADATEVTYAISACYSPEHGRGIRFDDPAFAIEWPLAVTAISPRDRAWVDFRLERQPAHNA
jgi:dTDP-4-dehydrorhamnose 3,5-epimerase